MTRRQVNNAVLAVALGLITVGAAGALPNIDLPNFPIPSPTPDDPPGPLAPLVPEEQRPLFVQFFNDMATVVESDTAGVLATMDQVRTMQTGASRLLVQSGKLPLNQTLSTKLMQRQEAQFGLEAKPVTPELRAQLAAFYRQVAEDF